MTIAEQTIFNEALEEGINIGREEGINIGTERGRQEGISIGKEEGALTERRKNALNLIKMGLSVEQVSKATDLTEEEVKAIEEQV